MCFAEVEEKYPNEGYKYFEQDFMDNNADDDRSSDTEDNSFERIAKKMIDVTADGGVKKQTLLNGIGEVIPPDANVSSNCIL